MLKVSLVTAVRNDARVVDTIKSVAAQTYPHIEHIVVDGLSNDGTWELIQQHAPSSAVLIHEKDKGMYDALNNGIRRATGDIVGFLNSDDVFAYPEVVERIVQTFEQNPAIQATHGDVSFHDESGKLVRSWKGRDFEPGLFEKSWTPAHPTFYTYRHNYEAHGLYNTAYRIASDGALMYRFLEIHRLPSKYIPSVFVKMAIGGASTSGLKSTWTITKEMQKGFQEHRRRFPMVKYLFHKALKMKHVVFAKAAA